MLVGLGALALGEAVGLRDEWPGARLLPAVVGLALVLLGVAHLTGPALEPAAAWPDAAGRRRLAFVSIVLSFYVFGLPTLGFLTATALFLFVLLRGLGSLSWVTAGVVAGAVAFASQVVFRRWLRPAAPVGPARPLTMETLGFLLQGLAQALTPQNLLFALIGTVLGTLVGVLPGIGPTVGPRHPAAPRRRSSRRRRRSSCSPRSTTGRCTGARPPRSS